MKITETKQKTSEIITEMKNSFDVFCYYDMEKLDKDFPPPKEITTRYFKDNVEADEELKNKSANDLKKGGIVGITLRERLLMEIQYFKKTGNHLDIDNITLCSGSRDSDGDVPLVYWDADNREVYVDWSSVSLSYDSLRARAVVSKPLSSNLVPFAAESLESRLKALEDWKERVSKLLA